MENLRNDIYYALGRFRDAPMATFIIVFTLALGIGATSAIFSIVNGVLLNAAPFSDAERLVTLRQFQPDVENSRMGFSAKEILDYREQSNSLKDVGEYHNMTFTLYGHGDPQRVNTGVVSANFFPMLGLKPVLGRLFNPDEDQLGAAPLILLTHEFWVKEFGSDPDVIGRTVEMNNRAHEIIGVLPAFPQFPNINDVYMAIPSCPWRSGETALTNRGARFLSGFGKLDEGVSLAGARAESSAIANRISSSFPEDYPREGGFDATALSLTEELVSGSRSYLLVLLGTTVLVLMISCANVTNLILSQHARRQREFAVRSALGATRSVLAKQLLTESVLLALMAGMLGLLFAYLGLDLLQGLATHFTSRAHQIVINPDVMVFTMLVSLTTGIIAGIVPGLARQELVTALKEGGKASYSTRGGPVRNLLLVAQFALSLTLLVSAAMAIKSLLAVQQIDQGYDTADIQAVQLDLNWTRYDTATKRWQMTRTIMDEVADLPHVDQVTAAFTYPMDAVMSGFGQVRAALQLDDRPFNPDDIVPDAYSRPVSHDYFKSLGIRVIEGREFSTHDTSDDPAVMVINQSLAKQFWPNASAIDHKISLDNGTTWITIVGVVADVRERDLTVSGDHQLYRPLAQSADMHVAILASTTAEPRRFNEDIRTIIRRVDDQQAISKVESLALARQNSISLQSFIAQVLTLFALIAMFITVSGISGVLGYMVSVRTREIGIRMAVGAGRKDVLILILFYGIRLSLIGLVLGIAGAWWMADLLNEHLYNVSRMDVSIYIISLAAMLGITITASLFPSYRASMMNPNQALKAV